MILPTDSGRSVCAHLDLLFHFGLGGVLPSGRELRALFGEPVRRPAHEIGGEDSKLLLEKDGRGCAHLQVVYSPGQNGDQEFQYFSLRAMYHGFLVEPDGLVFVDQAGALDKLAPHDHHAMLG